MATPSNANEKAGERTFHVKGMELKADELEGEQAKRYEAELTHQRLKKELQRAHMLGLDPADSIVDKELASTFARGEIPHFAGINTFLKTTYLEDIRKVGDHEVAIVGCPLDTGTTYRPGSARQRRHQRRAVDEKARIQRLDSVL